MIDYTEKENKYIREDDPVLAEDAEYTNYLADAYEQTGDMQYRDALLAAFDDYFKKYVRLLHLGGGSISLNNKDTKNFLRLFMNAEDRSSEYSYFSSAAKYIHSIRRVMTTFTTEDLYHEMIVIFLQLLENYKPITYVRNGTKRRISFAHYIQVNLRYGVAMLVRANRKDIITGRDCLEYIDELNAYTGPDLCSEYEEITLKNWVWGDSSDHPFSDLSEIDRYLLWLRYESSADGKMLTTEEIGNITGYHQRTIIYRLRKIKARIKQLLGGMNEMPKMRKRRRGVL